MAYVTYPRKHIIINTLQLCSLQNEKLEWFICYYSSLLAKPMKLANKQATH